MYQNKHFTTSIKCKTYHDFDIFFCFVWWHIWTEKIYQPLVTYYAANSEYAPTTNTKLQLIDILEICSICEYLYIGWHKKNTPGLGGHSYSRGDTYVRLFSPLLLASPSPKDPIFFHKIVCCHQMPLFFRKIEILIPNDIPIFEKHLQFFKFIYFNEIEIFCNENPFFQIWNYFLLKGYNM